MSGGDLDGDKFIVIWDPDIIPRKISEPAMYPQVQEQISFSAPGDDDRAKYFARYTSTSISGTKILYLKWARSKGPMSAECQQLNRLYSLALDGKVVTVPASLQDPPDAAVDATPFILDVLHSAVKETIEAASVGNIRFLDAPISAMDLLLSNDVIAIPEFDLIQLTIRWCRRYGQDFWDYSCFFNFGALTDSEQAWTLGQLPPSKSGPALVRNGLLQSNIVSPEELRRFGLDHHGFHWKCIFDSSFDTMGRFMSSACDALELFHKKLILIRPDERLLIAILIKDKIPKANDTHVSSNVRVLALPQSQGPDSPHYRVAPTTLRYRLYCDETTFQLYDGKRQNTFVFLKRDVRNSSQGNNNNKEDRRWLGQSNGANFMASIALDKLGKGIQTHVGRIYRARILAAVSGTQYAF
jgi:regulator of nonsense transcripts 1